MSKKIKKANVNKKGFTLIELLVCVLIIGILTVYAYPSYTYYIRNANANGLKTQLLEISSTFERIKKKNFSYQTLLGADGQFNTTIISMIYPTDAVGDDILFNLSVTNVSHSSYTIIATPTSKQGTDYGKISLEVNNNSMIGRYDVENDSTWAETWY